MYCNFVMVNENCKIVKENIPPQSVLTRLANRLFKVSGIYDAWTEELTQKWGAREVVLDPSKIAEHFRQFHSI